MNEAMRAARKASGLSWAQLTKKTGVPKQTILRWEKGQRSPTVELCCAVCDVLGVSLDEYIGRERKEMEKCKFCGLPVLSGNVVHSDCAEAAIEAAALTNEERQELDAYRAIGVPADELPWLMFLMNVLEDWDRAKRIVELVKADEEGRLAIFTEAPEI